ncbi:hypothetical protein A33M_1349 [Rhodovulum sp. PH10]|nr:hypothetical protein A33M_1349 [Rhodovulum sp. PH10]
MAGLGAALGQAANYSTREAVQDTSVRINVHASGNKASCSPAALPTITVLTPPKSGTLTVRRGELTTNKIAGCPRLKLPAQVIFYRSRADFVGTDRVVYGMAPANGKPEVFDVTIEVKERAREPGPGTKGDRI